MTALFALAGCGDAGSDGTDAAPGSVARDSAGVAIVETDMAAASPPAWSLSDAPLLSIGSLDGADDATLYRAIAAFKDSGGRLVIGNAGTHEVRWYGADGALVARSGHEGDGPGEYSTLSWVGPARADSVAAFDYRERRVTVIGPDGSVGRTYRLDDFPQPEDADEPEFTWPVVVGPLDGGELMVASNPSAFTGPTFRGVPEDSVEYFRFGPEGALLDLVLRERFNEQYVESTGNSVSVFRVPFGRSTQAAAIGSALWVGQTNSQDIRRYGTDGTLQLIVRRRAPLRPVTDDDIRTYQERELAGVEDPGQRSRYRETLERVPYGGTHPTFASFLVEADGHLWVQEYVFDAEADPESGGELPAEWSVFAPNGWLVGSVTLPPGVQLRWIGPDRIVTQRRDDLDVEYVEVFGLERSTVPTPEP